MRLLHGLSRRIPRVTRWWLALHDASLTRYDWYLIGERGVVVACAAAALLYAIGVIR